MTEPDRTQEDRPRHRWADRLDERRERHKERGRLYRFAFACAGAVVTLAGLVMLVTPGPALVVIPIGLAMLAMEFAWAEAALERALLQAEKAQATAKEATLRQKVLGVATVVLLAGAAVAAVFYWNVPVPVVNPS